ncbi:hypothetical protein ACOTTU_11190 [Roseobacter sp. EG26]|uniref:hypothetical protein n=1 Tax=Roseobacter sp. EG26 TaxID=3412477 RepID=UPI003CE569C1
MSNMEASGGTEPIPEGEPGATEHPVFEAGWKDRLSEARAKRNRLLSSRRRSGPEDTPLDPSIPKGNVPGEEPEPGNHERTGFWLGVIHANARVLMLVFFGAAGLGLGVTLGIGALTGVGASRVVTVDPVPDPVLTVQTQKVATVTPPLEESPPPAKPVVIDAVLADAGNIPDVLDMPLTVVEPSPVQVENISLPAISAVQYMRADTEPAAALNLRSLPDLSATDTDEMVYDAFTTDRLLFYIHAPDGISNGRLQAYVSTLEDAGIAVAAIGRENFRVSATHLRYYSPQNASVAQNVASNLGVEARDFSQNSTNTERIEVWLAGRPKAVEEIEEPQVGFFARLFNSQKVDAEALSEID